MDIHIISKYEKSLQACTSGCYIKLLLWTGKVTIVYQMLKG